MGADAFDVEGRGLSDLVSVFLIPSDDVDAKFLGS